MSLTAGRIDSGISDLLFRIAHLVLLSHLNNIVLPYLRTWHLLSEFLVAVAEQLSK
jgi:hypothetical protein